MNRNKIALRAIAAVAAVLFLLAISNAGQPSAHPVAPTVSQTAVPGPVVTRADICDQTVTAGPGACRAVSDDPVTLPGLATATPGTTWLNAGPGDNVCRNGNPNDCGYGDNPGPGNAGNGDHLVSISNATATIGERDAFESWDNTTPTDANGYVHDAAFTLTRVDQCQVTATAPIGGPGTIVGAGCAITGPRSIVIRLFKVTATGTVVPAAKETVTVNVLVTQHLY